MRRCGRAALEAQLYGERGPTAAVAAAAGARGSRGYAGQQRRGVLHCGAQAGGQRQWPGGQLPTQRGVPAPAPERLRQPRAGARQGLQPGERPISAKHESPAGVLLLLLQSLLHSLTSSDIPDACVSEVLPMRSCSWVSGTSTCLITVWDLSSLTKAQCATEVKVVPLRCTVCK